MSSTKGKPGHRTPYDKRGHVGTAGVQSRSTNPGDVKGVTTDVGGVGSAMNKPKTSPRSESIPHISKPGDTTSGFAKD